MHSRKCLTPFGCNRLILSFLNLFLKEGVILFFYCLKDHQMLYPQAEIIQKIRCIQFCVKVTSNKASKALSSSESLLPKRQHTLSFIHLPWKQLMFIPSELLESLAERNKLSGVF